MATYNKKIELKRVNMNLPVQVTQKVEDFAAKNGLNTTNAYIILLNQALNYQQSMEMLPLLPTLMSELKELTDNENLQKELNEDK